MKILYLAPDPLPAPKGAAIRINRNLRTLTSLGHQVSVFTPALPRRGDSDAELPTPEELPGVDYTTVPLTHRNMLKRMMLFRRAAAEWLATQEADVVQFRGLWEGVSALQWARQTGAKAIYEVHGVPSIELPYHYPSVLKNSRLMEKLVMEETRLLGAVDLTLTHSRTGRRYLMSRGVQPRRIAMIPNAVDTALFCPSPVPPPNELPLRLVYQGTMAPWQGIMTLIEALNPLRNAGVELHLVGPLKKKWRRELRTHAQVMRVRHLVHMSPATDQAGLVPVLQSAHVCVAPMPADSRNTVQGCCPIKVLEYMACGRPILATNLSIMAELLTHMESGYLCEPSGAAALTQGIRWMIENPHEREQLGQNAREQLLLKWTPDHFRVHMQNAYEQMEDLAIRNELRVQVTGGIQ